MLKSVHIRAAIIAAAVIVPSARADLPPGFTRTMLAGGDDVGAPTSMAILPDLRVVVGDYYGRVSLITPNQPAVTLFYLEDVWADVDHGLLGMTADPNFAANGYFYIFYSAMGPYDRIVRYTLAGSSVDINSRTLIWQNPDVCPGESHHGGAINFGPDGNLYITTGEQYDHPMNAQTLANQHGKILRLAADGSVPPDNPYVSTPGAQPEIWAYGLRNPFRATMDLPTGNLWIGDVGGADYEEINRMAVGANFGWPFMEGPECSVSSCAAFTPPVFAYSHTDPVYSADNGAAIVCGPIYRGTAFPPEYRGNLFYGDWVNGWIRRLVFDDAGNIIYNVVFDTAPSVTTLTDLKLGPDGALYYITTSPTIHGFGGLYRISATSGGNQAPVVVVGAAPLRVDTGVNVQFNSTGTHDPDASPQPLTYNWDFGDGQTSTLPNPTHSYAARGPYQVRLTVSDGADPVTSDPIAITVGHAPVPTILTPAPGTTYSADDSISFSGSATDTEDGPLPASAFTWSVVLVHLSHIHDFYGPVSGSTSGSAVIPNEGHDPENTHYRIVLTVHDSDGIPATTTLDLVPNISALFMQAAPQGIPVFIDGRAIQTPRIYQSLVGFHHQIAAQPTFALDGIEHDFLTWSNSQPATFDYVSPDGGDSLTAIYSGSCASADFNCDGDTGTDQDIEAFFACLSGNCPPLPCLNTADFNRDGDIGTDQDIESFFRVLSGSPC